MAGNKQQQNQKKFSLFSIFKSRRPRRSGDHHDNYNYGCEDSGRKIWPSDEDKGGRWVAEPGIDRRASAFIAKFHETRVSESEHHAVYQAKA
ncbi:hypothetical protein Ddye_029442 [Dipteronia dyeriana]|uniref:Uncharacterized protein n=1 Tax=Dipteronia dyeriana TaxID=168575 RepID=A0AAD9WLQ7_9ROSI|nr:hypothetical protein Ddye_029442 [Dipteronia dyeriana]